MAHQLAAGASYEFVIITTDDLESYVWPIENWEICKGRTVLVETVEDIASEYSGSDLQQKIRNYLRANRSSWGILKVLLVGDIDDVPMRYCYTENPDGVKGYYPTDYYYAELTYADSSSWDSDNDGYYGEEGQDNIDFVNEVDVGRIPWSDGETVERICLKMAEYELSTNMTYKNSILMPEAFWDSSTDNAMLTNYMWNDFLSADGWSRRRLYEYGPHYYSVYTRDASLSHTNVTSDWASGRYGYVCLSGHGSATSISYDADYNWYHFIESNDAIEDLDDYPSFMYANSCSTSYPENASNLGRSFLNHGGVGYIGSTRMMYYGIGWDSISDGWGSTLAYLFSEKMCDGTSTVGWSHQRALRDMYNTYGWDDHWFSMFEYVLYGNPDMWVRERPGGIPDITYTVPDGWSYEIVPRNISGATETDCVITETLPGNSSSTYYNLAWKNNGTNTAPMHQYILTVDDETVFSYSTSVSGDTTRTFKNYQASKIVTGGRHVLRLDMDTSSDSSWGKVFESNEYNNAVSRAFVWSPYQLNNNTAHTLSSAPPKKNPTGYSKLL